MVAFKCTATDCPVAANTDASIIRHRQLVLETAEGHRGAEVTLTSVINPRTSLPHQGWLCSGCGTVFHGRALQGKRHLIAIQKAEEPHRHSGEKAIMQYSLSPPVEEKPKEPVVTMANDKVEAAVTTGPTPIRTNETWDKEWFKQ